MVHFLRFLRSFMIVAGLFFGAFSAGGSDNLSLFQEDDFELRAGLAVEYDGSEGLRSPCEPIIKCDFTTENQLFNQEILSAAEQKKEPEYPGILMKTASHFLRHQLESVIKKRAEESEKKDSDRDFWLKQAYTTLAVMAVIPRVIWDAASEAAMDVSFQLFYQGASYYTAVASASCAGSGAAIRQAVYISESFIFNDTKWVDSADVRASVSNACDAASGVAYDRIAASLRISSATATAEFIREKLADMQGEQSEEEQEQLGRLTYRFAEKEVFIGTIKNMETCFYQIFAAAHNELETLDLSSESDIFNPIAWAAFKQAHFNFEKSSNKPAAPLIAPWLEILDELVNEMIKKPDPPC